MCHSKQREFNNQILEVKGLKKGMINRLWENCPYCSRSSTSFFLHLMWLCRVHLWRQIFKETNIVQQFYFFISTSWSNFSRPPNGHMTKVLWGLGWGNCLPLITTKKHYIFEENIQNICQLFFESVWIQMLSINH